MAGEGNNSLNSFTNDGSFLERFKKLQEEKIGMGVSGVVSANTSNSVGSPVTPQPAALLRKSKPIVMKLSTVKKKAPLVHPKGKAEKTFSRGPLVESDEEEDTDTKTEHGICLAKSIGLVTPPDASKLDRSDGSRQAVSATSSSMPPLPSPQSVGKKRKRNRWSDTPVGAASSSDQKGSVPPLGEDERAMASAMASFSEVHPPPLETTKQNLSKAQLEQLQEQIEMNKLVASIRATTRPFFSKKRKTKDPKQQYEYDSDEDIEGGSWEHKKRQKEMLSTYKKALEITELGKGKHHIGDYLPPEELDRFLEKVKAIKEGRDPDFSDYKDNKIDESNIGFRMLQKAGWSEGKGLGDQEEGIINPINKGKCSFDQAGVGAEMPAEINKEDSSFDTYRKRMMLAYRFRPNPLNNPRRPYY